MRSFDNTPLVSTFKIHIKISRMAGGECMCVYTLNISSKIYWKLQKFLWGYLEHFKFTSFWGVIFSKPYQCGSVKDWGVIFSKLYQCGLVKDISTSKIQYVTIHCSGLCGLRFSFDDFSFQMLHNTYGFLPYLVVILMKISQFLNDFSFVDRKYLCKEY